MATSSNLLLGQFTSTQQSTCYCLLYAPTMFLYTIRSIASSNHFARRYLKKPSSPYLTTAAVGGVFLLDAFSSTYYCISLITDSCVIYNNIQYKSSKITVQILSTRLSEL